MNLIARLARWVFDTWEGAYAFGLVVGFIGGVIL